MRKILMLSACAGLCAFTAVTAIAADTKPAAAPKPAASVTAAIADAGRPKADTDRDIHRKPAETLAFAGVKPGMVVAEILPGGGYFTRIIAKAVTPGGKVYALSNPGRAGTTAAAKTISEDPKYGGVVTYTEGPVVTLKAPVPVDLVWTSQNYHDLPQRDQLNKTAFEMLKPGGIYFILDHSALVGTGDFATNQPGGAAANLHRIDENLVKLEVMKAGFKYIGESDALRNAKDTRTTRVFEGSIRGDTDQFILKFQKPAK